MSDEVVEQQECHYDAIREFNRRLNQGGTEFQFPEELCFPVGDPRGLRKPSDYHNVELHKYLWVDGDRVRGGYMVIGHGAFVNGTVANLQFLKLPLSEAIVDPQFSAGGALLLHHAVRRAPLMYGLGGGGADSAVMKMLKRCKFVLHPVPFHFRILNFSHFLRHIQYLRKSPLRAFALDVLSFVPFNSRVVNLYHALKAERGLSDDLEVEVLEEFGTWADALWEESCGNYSFIAIRDAATLNWRLPTCDKRIHRLKVSRQGRLLGWVAVTNNLLSGHKQFGSMRLGSIVDALAISGAESFLVAAATQFLRQSKVDLIVSNQCAQAWMDALDRNGFVQAKSNFVFAASPRLAELIGRTDPDFKKVQINRCDGDGPIHL